MEDIFSIMSNQDHRAEVNKAEYWYSFCMYLHSSFGFQLFTTPETNKQIKITNSEKRKALFRE